MHIKKRLHKKKKKRKSVTAPILKPTIDQKPETFLALIQTINNCIPIKYNIPSEIEKYTLKTKVLNQPFKSSVSDYSL